MKKEFLHEEGGAGSNTGASSIICGPNGEKLPVAPGSKTGGYSGDVHATFVWRPDAIVIFATWRRKDPFPYHFVATRAGYEVMIATGYKVEDAPEWLRPAVQAAMEKAGDYHCRHSYYHL